MARRILSAKQTRLSMSIKRINQRITSLEKAGFKMTRAYQVIKKAKYGKQNVVTTKKGGQRTPTAPRGTTAGGLKIRTDVANMTDEEIEAVEKLIEKFENEPSTITEIKRDTGKKLKYYWEHHDDFYNKYEGAEMPEDYEPEEFSEDEFTIEEMQQYLLDRERITADAIAKAFYMQIDGVGTFSDLYYAVDSGEMSYKDAKEYAINNLIWLYRNHGLNAKNDFYDEDIITSFYQGTYY